MRRFKEKYYQDAFGKSEREVALDLWSLGELVQANHGKWTESYLRAQSPELAYLLDDPMMIDGILFVNRDGVVYCIRHLNFNHHRELPRWERGYLNEDGVWAGGKGDGRWRWVRNWISKFGGGFDPVISKKYNDLLAEWRGFYAPPELPIVKRQMDTGWMEKLPTMEVAHRWAVAQVMNNWMQALFAQDFFVGRSPVYAWMRGVWSEQVGIMQSELEYRTAGQPEKRSSKKKTEAAKRDFRLANEVLVKGVGGFFADDFLAMVRETAFPFNVADLDYEQLPERAPENKPIKWMSDAELVADFMRFVDADFDEDSFEADDRRLLLDNLRKQYARIRGQAVE